MTMIKNGIRMDAITVDVAEDRDIEFIVRVNGTMAIFRLTEILKSALGKSKDYDDDKLEFVQSLINTGHRLTS
jgi:hypothetical protein